MRTASDEPRITYHEPRATSDGFSLVEMIVVIAITVVIAAGAAAFMRFPLQAYQDAERRAGISDAADTAFTRLKRDLQTALPNSVRVAAVGPVFYLEFLQTRTGGRYRSAAPTPAAVTGANTCTDANGDGFADENVLAFGVADTCLTSLGTVPSLGSIVANSDFVVVFNLGAGFANADAYASGAVTGGNKSRITAVAAGSGGENVITFQSNTFNLESPGRRFQIVSGALTYVCDPAAGTLRRISGYSIAAAQPTPPAGTSVLVAQRITGCSVTYDQNVVNQRNGVVALWLRFTDPAGGSTVNLFQQIQVSNVP